MSVQQCIEAYKTVSKRAFIPRSTIHLPGSLKGQYSGEKLEKVLKEVIAEQCRARGCNKEGCGHEDMVFKDANCCKTSVASKNPSRNKLTSWKRSPCPHQRPRSSADLVQDILDVASIGKLQSLGDSSSDFGRYHFLQKHPDWARQGGVHRCGVWIQQSVKDATS